MSLSYHDQFNVVAGVLPEELSLAETFKQKMGELYPGGVAPDTPISKPINFMKIK